MKRTDPLHCSDFENRVHQLLDDRLILNADLRLTEHAEECPECAALMQEYDNLGLVLTLDEPSHGLSKSPPKPTTEFLTRNTSVLLALVAMLVISLNIYSSFLTKINPPTVVVTQSTSPPTIGLFNPKSMPARVTHRKTKTSRPPSRPIPSPFNLEFSIANSIRGIQVPRVPTWKSISPQIDSLKPWVNYSKPLFEYSPALFPVCHIGYRWKETIELIQQSILESNAKSDIGQWDQSTNFRTA
ncbi:MAG: hypothetical protein OSA89_04215 [Mariniblastus sp.]|nr:hypothetical protein [Mariniblastus sp.]